MNSKNNRQNHDFQIVHFLAGACHTPDGAFSLLCDLKEDRENALALAEASEMRTRAKAIRAKDKIRTDNEADQLEGRADLKEIEALAETVKRNVEGAKAELATIVSAIEQLKPLRKFANLPDAQAHEAAQREEWKLELISKAQNHLLLTGSIPVDYYAVMRQHPDFSTEILPVVEHTHALMKKGGTAAALPHTVLPGQFNLPQLLNT